MRRVKAGNIISNLDALILSHIKNTCSRLLVSGLLMPILFYAQASHAQENCKYLDRYLAPLELPVDNRPNEIAGPAPGDVQQRLVGPDECRIIDEKIIHNSHGVPYRQVTVAISGSVFGYAPINAEALPPDPVSRDNTFTDHALLWQSQGTMGPFIPGVGYYKYSDETQLGVEILIPQNSSDWNGHMWVLVHGAGRFPPLEIHPRLPGKYNRYTESSGGAGPLIDMGFAVVWTRRDAAITDKDSMLVANTAVLDDGTEIGGPGKLGMGFNDNTGVIRDYTVISRNYIEEQLGRRPGKIFYRGHSAGGAMGRSFLLIRGMNTDHQGEQLFHGFYLDDSAAGRGAPVYYWESEVVDEHGSFRLKPSDRDKLIFNAEQMRWLMPTIEVIHGNYAGGNTDTVPKVSDRVPSGYLHNKRENTRMNIEKGLGEIWKSYEIAGVSHSDASSASFEYPELAKDMVDIGGVAIPLMNALINWVLNGTPPPATRVDAKDVWDLDPNAGPAIHLPDTACPRGIYRNYMPRPDGGAFGSSPAMFIPYLTELVPQINEDEERPAGFKEEWLEPVDRRGNLIDMTGALHRRTRPTIQQIWSIRYREGKSTGILRPYESLTRERYVSCVAEVASNLRDERLLTEEAVQWYIEKAKNEDIGVD